MTGLKGKGQLQVVSHLECLLNICDDSCNPCFEEGLEHLPNRYSLALQMPLIRNNFVICSDTPNVLLQDLYHHQRTAGNLTQTLIDYMPYVGKKAIKFLLFYFCFCFYFLIYIFHTQR